MEKMNPPLEFTVAKVGVTEKLLLGMTVEVGLSVGAFWIEAIGSGMTVVEVEVGMVVEVTIVPFWSNPNAIQPMERMLMTNTAINIPTIIFFSKSDFNFMEV